REAGPGRQRTRKAATRQTDGQPHLAAGRAGKELAKRNQIGVAAFVEPASPGHELFAKVAQVRHRTTEGGQAQAQDKQKNHPATRGLRLAVIVKRHARFVWSEAPWLGGKDSGRM